MFFAKIEFRTAKNSHLERSGRWLPPDRRSLQRPMRSLLFGNLINAGRKHPTL